MRSVRRLLLPVLLGCLALSLLIVNVSGKDEEPVVQKRTTVVLIGATGSLSKKYLWQALFDLHNTHEGKGLHVIGAARAAKGKGRPIIDEIISGTTCHSDIPKNRCDTKRDDFVARVKYHQLKYEDDYKTLGLALKANADAAGEEEAGRIFYLSIPPFAYSETAGYINMYCRPTDENTFIRVALEKPFGSDTESAQIMADEIEKSLHDDEVYRVDHYLGKYGVQQITTFRQNNKKWWQEHIVPSHVERVEIVMKETEDCKGRTAFYDEYGVIRDVFQNHLTEILALVAMELPEESEHYREDFLEAKAIALKRTRIHDVLMGQYADYEDQVREDSSGEKERSHVATFAAVTLDVNLKNWKDVPFVLVAGKNLDVREAYVAIKMKHANVFCVTTDPRCGRQDITFHIQGGSDGAAKVIVNGVSADEIEMPFPHRMVDSGSPHRDVFALDPNETDKPYSLLMHMLYTGDRTTFVDVDGLMASWEIWTPLLRADPKSVRNMNIYPNGGTDLDFVVVEGGTLAWVIPPAHTKPTKGEFTSKVDEVKDEL